MGRRLDYKIAEIMEWWKETDKMIVPFFSADISSAMLFVEWTNEKLNEADYLDDDIGYLTLIALGKNKYAASFFCPIEQIEEWWERVDEVPFTAKSKKPAYAICLAGEKAFKKTKEE